MSVADPSRSPLLSVIIPSFNQARFLERALCSVLDQQGRADIEVLVVDGGSEDATVPLLTSYDADLAYWTTRWDAGPAEAINHALSKTTGQYVTILSADDLWQPTALDAIRKAIAAHPHADWLQFDAQRIDAYDRELGVHPCESPRSLAALLEHDTAPLPMSVSVFRRALFSMLGPLEGSLRYAWGYEWSCRLVKHGILPRIVRQTTAGLREIIEGTSARHAFVIGEEYVAVAQHYLDELELPEKRKVYIHCDERRRIYTLARAEAQLSQGHRLLWEQALRRPWWLANDDYRQKLLAGDPQAQRDVPRRLAA
jgi:glycosyltransferase involved in cell wall biosynthesis